MVLRLEVSRHHHPHRGGYPRPRVTGIEGIVDALLPLAKTAKPFILPQRVKPLGAPRQELMGIGLIAGIPDNLVLRRVQQVVQGYGQFNDA